MIDGISPGTLIWGSCASGLAGWLAGWPGDQVHRHPKRKLFCTMCLSLSVCTNSTGLRANETNANLNRDAHCVKQHDWRNSKDTQKTSSCSKFYGQLKNTMETGSSLHKKSTWQVHFTVNKQYIFATFFWVTSKPSTSQMTLYVEYTHVGVSQCDHSHTLTSSSSMWVTGGYISVENSVRGELYFLLPAAPGI